MRRRLSRTSIFDVLLVVILFGGIMATGLTAGIQVDQVPIVAAIAASLFSVAAVLGTYMTVQEMRADRIERNKPFVFVDFSFTGSSLVFYLIRNMGSSSAEAVVLRM